MKAKPSPKVKALAIFYDKKLDHKCTVTHVESWCNPNCVRSLSYFVKHICEVTYEYYMNIIQVGHN